MHTIVQVEPLADYRLKLRFADGVEGIVDLSTLAGCGVFCAWQNPALFRQVKIAETGELVWGKELDLCPDALYLQLTGQKPEDVFPALHHELVHA